MIDTAHEDIKCEPKPVAWMYKGKDWMGAEICTLSMQRASTQLSKLTETPLYDHKPVPFQDTALYAQRMETEKYKAMLFTSWQTIREQAKGLNRLSNKVKNLNKKYKSDAVYKGDAMPSENNAPSLTLEDLYPTYGEMVVYADRYGVSMAKARVRLLSENIVCALSKDNVTTEQLKMILMATARELLL